MHFTIRHATKNLQVFLGTCKTLNILNLLLGIQGFRVLRYPQTFSG